VLTTSVSYKLINADLAKSLKNTASEPQVARESAYYLAHIGDVTSIDDFLKNDRLYRFAMKAFGLSDMIYAKAFMKKVLTEGVDKKTSFANKLVDPRFREFAKVFNFATYGATATSTQDTQQGTVDRYVRQTLEEDAGQQNEGVQLALYFARKAPNLTSTYGILADKALITVVQTALGISSLTSAQDVDTQAKMLAKRIDVADFKDPKKLQKFINRFTSMWDISNASSNAASSPAAILIAQPVEAGISATLLSSLQNLKRGGS
jgi:hypothetical protein